MQAYIKYKAYYDKKNKTSNLKQADYAYVLQPKADHQASKIPFRDFRWTVPYFIEKVLQNKNYLVLKIGTNKTQVLLRKSLYQFTPSQLMSDIQIAPREWKPDPEVIIQHDDLYARAWECEQDKTIFDSDYNKLVAPNTPKITVRSKEAADAIRSTPWTILENSPEICPQTDW